MTPEQEEQRPEWAHTIQEYLVEVEAYKKETPRSQCFTRLLDKLPFVPAEFVRDYNRGMEASHSGEEKGAVVRGEADALFGSVIVEFEKKLPNEISAAASCGVSERVRRQAASEKWPLRRPAGADK